MEWGRVAFPAEEHKQKGSSRTGKYTMSVDNLKARRDSMGLIRSQIGTHYRRQIVTAQKGDHFSIQSGQLTDGNSDLGVGNPNGKNPEAEKPVVHVRWVGD